MSRPQPITVDFETFGIQARPLYPSVPVGVSIKCPGEPARYYAWGHLTGNNCSYDKARAALSAVWGEELLFQNGKFDLDVAETHLDLPLPAWDHVHDTMFLLFLDDPNQADLSLKPSAERLCNMRPEERDAVADWLIEHQPVPGVKISKAPRSEHYFMGYLAYAPGDLVGTYANGDVVRTERLFNKLWPSIKRRRMLEAYDRERRLMPRLLSMERRGLPVDVKRLSRDVRLYVDWQVKLDAWLLKRLRASAELNLNSGDQLIEALLAAKKLDETKLQLTKTGKYQSNKEALLEAVTDATLLAALKYRAQLNTCLNTFMQPWLETAEASGGLIFTTWNQVKGRSSGGAIGARTGRLSSTPNFMNIPNEFKPIFKHEDVLKKLPPLPQALSRLPALPLVRSYVTPFEGHVLIDRDYSQQEPRILGHFEGGVLMKKYQANPWLDVHDDAQAELANAGLHYERKPVKNTNLGLIYGMGVPKLAMKNDMPVSEAKALKQAVLQLYPGLKAMYQDAKQRAKAGEPIRTWGGREYYCEEPVLKNGRLHELDYKLVNTLIQGSGADCTKEAIIRYLDAIDQLGKADWYLLLNVHDQLTSSVPSADRDEAMEVKRQAMESIEFDVPMLTEGEWSPTNWEALRPYDKRGKRV